ncbi:MAG: BMP family lipoprotein [Candidatus Hermodarchaeia archaeon]|jgi:basic membrane protein A
MGQNPSLSTTAIVLAIIALIVGAGVGYVVAPKGVSQEDFVALQSENTDLKAQITSLTSPKKIGLILATGGLGDKSFNDLSYEGVTRAEDELGIAFDFVQPTAIAEYESLQRNFAASGDYELIICVGFDQLEAIQTVAGEYPNQLFVLIDEVSNRTNVASLTFRGNEGAFLVGVIAAGVTDTGIIGFVGGMDIPLIRDFYVGYEAGALWLSDELNFDVTVLEPSFVGDWGDPSGGREVALSLTDLDADVLFVAAGGSGLGALGVCDDSGIWGIGVDASQGYLNDAVVASATKRVDVAIYEQIVKVLLGTFEGKPIEGGLAEGWAGCDRLPDEEEFWEDYFEFDYDPDRTLHPDIVFWIELARFAIISGNVVVPSGFT